MSDNEMVVEVLRLDAEATPGPWEWTTPPSEDSYTCVWDDHGDLVVEGNWEGNTALIAYYRTAAPALAREVQRLQGEVDRLLDARTIDRLQAHGDGYQDGHRAGQEAMRERAAALCRERQEKHRRGRIRCGPGKKFGKLQVAEDEAFSCVSAIRTLEVER